MFARNAVYLSFLPSKIPALRIEVSEIGAKYGVAFKLHIGLDRTGHMSFLTGQDRTPKFAGQVLPDRTESGLLFISILPTNYRLLLLII